MSTLAVSATQAAELRFPAGFWWGAATAAYQIEGAVTADGRIPSIWDTFSATPGKVTDGDTGEHATDHFHRFRDDVAIMAELGLAAYRFSVAWPRIRTAGGGVNRAGLAFYDRLVDAILGAGIKPVATLYHWDLPQELEDAGGWTNRDTAEHFADYAQAVAERIGDRVAMWNTLNEPWCSAFLGYGSGAHAPGHTDHAAALTAVHHLLLAHGRAVPRLRAAAPGVPVAIALNAGVVRPVTADPADVDAARRIDGLLNRIFLDPLLRGAYPGDVQADTGAVTDWAFVRDGDLELIGAPVDAIGVNYYQPDLVGAANGTATEPGSPYPTGEQVRHHPIDAPVTDMGWPIDPAGLRDVLTRIRADYGDVPVYVTENGAAYPDRLDDGRVHDPDRVDYLHQHLAAAHEALSAGVDLRGYFVWSLLDNFEWAYGYAKRFGIVHVDYATQVRTLKDSALWYRGVIAAGGVDRR